MPPITVRTWFTDGTELQGSPGTIPGDGYENVDHLRRELRTRWQRSFNAVDIPGGIELTPKPHHYCGHGKQHIYLKGHCNASS